MELSVAAILKMTLYAIFLGAAMGIIYDVFRISRVMIGVRYSSKERGALSKLYSFKYPLIGMLGRRESKIKDGVVCALVCIGDVLFSLLAGALFCIFLYFFNDGIFRWQALVFCVFGFFVYYNTVGRLVISLAEFFVIFLRILTKFLAFSIAFPFKMVYNIIIKVAWCIIMPPLNKIKRRSRVRNTRKRLDMLSAEAASGFIEFYMKGRGKPDAD